MRESDLTIVRALESDSSNENKSEPFDKSLRNLSKIVRKQYSASFFSTFSKKIYKLDSFVHFRNTHFCDFQKIEFHATKVAIIEQILKVSILKVLAGLNFGFRLAIFNDVSNPEGTERS